MFTSLPSAPVFHGLAVIALLALVFRRLRPLGLCLLACCWALIHYQLRLDDRLDPVLANQVITVEGLVSSIPAGDSDSVRFRFQPVANDETPHLPEVLLVSWYRQRPEISVGERWLLELRIKPPWGGVNFQGPDKERWLFAQGIGGLGTVRSGQLLAPPSGHRFVVNLLREKVLRNIGDRVDDLRQRGVIQALATADRSGLEASDSALLSATGTAHLLAISGLHVGLAAAGGMWLSRLALLFLPVSRMGSATLMVTLTGGLLSASGYAALAGFGIPTLRSLLMLLTALAAVMLSRSVHPARAWAASLAVVLVIDPLAPLGAGLWFSFSAVAALLWVFSPRTGRLIWWKTLLMAQCGVILVLAPVGAAWFNSFSPSAFAANLLAIPWVSILVVPPVLAGLAALPFSGLLAGMLWSVAGLATSVLFHFLELMSTLQGSILMLPPPGFLQALLALVGAALVLLPRGLPVRWMGLFLLIPLFLPPAPRTREGAIEAEILDVGQGTAVLVNSGRHSLLYDSGPGDGENRNLVSSVISPAVARLGPGAPGQVFISHADLDHAGGLNSLLHLYPDALFQANLGDENPFPESCTAPAGFRWPGVELATLHPSPWLPYMGNDSSCVISLESSGGRLLLSGDISQVVENRLLGEGIRPHKLLLVPHHGSKTSSSPVFIDRIQPEVAIATASLGNRFDFPRTEVRQRFQAAGAKFWTTGECGALRVMLQADGTISAVSARRERNRMWRWPAAANCP